MALRSNESEPAMATDYDAPRKQEEESPSESLEALQASRSGSAQTAVIDVDENDTAEGIDLPGADLSGEELTVIVVPEQSDEFTCSSCFLVRHRSQVAREKTGLKYCRECAGCPHPQSQPTALPPRRRQPPSGWPAPQHWTGHSRGEGCAKCLDPASL
jgi:hypothetical protein